MIEAIKNLASRDRGSNIEESNEALKDHKIALDAYRKSVKDISSATEISQDVCVVFLLVFFLLFYLRAANWKKFVFSGFV